MLKSVNDIIFDEVYLSIEMKTGEGFPSIGENGILSLGLDIELPEFITVADSRYKNGKLEVSDDFVKTADGLSLVIDPIKVAGLDLNMSREELSELADSIFIKGNATITGAELDLDEWTETSHNIDIIADIKTIKKDADSSTEKLLIKEVTGIVEYEIDPVDMAIDLSGIASTLQGDKFSLALDIKTFYLALGVKTNLGVPVTAELCLTPYFGGESGTPLQQPLTLEPASGAELKETKYWISNTPPAEGMGYDYMELDLLDLLFADASRTVLADSLKVSLVAATDESKECRFEPGADYELVVDYVAGVPFDLGENFKLEYRDTIATVDPLIVQLFEYGTIGLGGSVESNIPLNFNLSLNMLDAAGDVVDMGEGVGSLVIKGGGIAGEIVKTPIELVLGNRSGAEIPEINAIELIFSADTKDIASAPLNEKTSLRCVLNARIPEGISLDLKNMLQDKLVEDDSYEE